MAGGAEPDGSGEERCLAALLGDLRAPSPGAVLLVLALGVFLYESGGVKPQYDDAYISYRYATNWVAGQGLVFNPGEYVEGFSNPLWTLLVAAGLALGAGAVATGHALGVATGALTLVASYAWARSGLTRAQSGWAGAASWVVLASPAFAQWSVSGMETPLFAATASAALAAGAWGRLGWAASFAGLAALTRPEGPLVAACLFGFALLVPGERRRTGLAIAAFAGLMLVFLALRLAYYGELVPNTFYAKVGGLAIAQSASFAAVFLAENAGLLALPALLAVARDRRWWPGAGFAVAIAAYGFSVGSVGRYLVPLVPCLAVLGVHGVARLSRAGGPARAAAAATLGLSFALCFFGITGTGADAEAGLLARATRVGGVAAARREFAKAEALGRRRARILAERGERDVLVATGAIGSFGFYSGLPILDILGLVDPIVARSGPAGDEAASALPGHRRSNPDYVLAREPEYILIARQVRDGFGALVPAPEQIRAHPDLARHYRWDARITGYRRQHRGPEPLPDGGAAPRFDRPRGHR